MIFLIDNYDSFAHNLGRYLVRMGQRVTVARNDRTNVDEIRGLRPDAIVISPGPCTPTEAGCSLDVARQLARQIPILGVCLGHQAIAAAFGAHIVRAPRPVHGQASQILHSGSGVFQGIPSPMSACRYHSLVIQESTLASEFQVTARTSDQVVMAIQHQHWPVVGLQFHPESILTEHGYHVLGNFFRLAGLPVPDPLPRFEQELVAQPCHGPRYPDAPVTF